MITPALLQSARVDRNSSSRCHPATYVGWVIFSIDCHARNQLAEQKSPDLPSLSHGICFEARKESNPDDPPKQSRSIHQRNSGSVADLAGNRLGRRFPAPELAIHAAHPDSREIASPNETIGLIWQPITQRPRTDEETFCIPQGVGTAWVTALGAYGNRR